MVTTHILTFLIQSFYLQSYKCTFIFMLVYINCMCSETRYQHRTACVPITNLERTDTKILKCVLFLSFLMTLWSHYKRKADLPSLKLCQINICVTLHFGIKGCGLFASSFGLEFDCDVVV